MRTEEHWKEHVHPRLVKRLFSARIQKDLLSGQFDDLNVPDGSVFIYGRVGCGKTIMSCMALLNDYKTGYMKGKHGKSYLFLPVSELFQVLKKSYAGMIEKNESEILDYWSGIDFLVLDDLGANKVSDWTWELLYVLINRRYENLKTTVINSNFSLQELAKQLGDDRIPSRIKRMCQVVKIER